MIKESTPLNKREVCCYRANMDIWGLYYCPKCEKYSCYLHITIWTDMKPYCFFCFSPCMIISTPKDVLTLRNKDIIETKKKALVVIDGLYIAGMQRHCLDLLDVFKKHNYSSTVIVVEEGGGGIWCNQFICKSNLLVLDYNRKLTWSKLLKIDNYPKYEFVVSHLMKPTKWVLNNIPSSIRKIAHLHSEISEHEKITDIEFYNVNKDFDMVLFPSLATFDHYRAKFSNIIRAKEIQKKWKVLSNAIPHEFSKAIFPKRNISYPKLKIAVISRVDCDKFSIPLFINTLLNLKKSLLKFELVIAGNGDSYDQLLFEIEKNNLQPFVTLLGFVIDIETIYNWSDLIFLPSKRESLPYVMLESLHFQVPIVLPKVGALKQESFSNQVYLFEPNNHSDAARLINTIADNRNNKQEVLINNSVLNYDKWSKTVCDVYRLHDAPIQL